MGRQHDFCMDNAAFASVVMCVIPSHSFVSFSPLR